MIEIATLGIAFASGFCVAIVTMIIGGLLMVKGKDKTLLSGGLGQ